MRFITINCGYRIHVNSIDMNGFSGRCCGGLGFALKEPNLKITISILKEKKNIINSIYPQKIERFLVKINNVYNLKDHYKVIVHNESKEHTGLGTETQMIFALATAILKLNNIEFTVDDIAARLHLAGVSGIGYGAYKYGNFIIDGGYVLGENKKDFVAHSTIPPKILCNYNIPDNWKVLLVIPKKIFSISDEEENNFFKMYTPVPTEEVKEICYYTFMGVLPAILEENFDNFINSLKIITMLGTKKAELKINEESTKVILEKMNNMFGFGALSSLGPACYTFIDSNRSDINIEKIKNEFSDCDVFITTVRNESFNLIEEEYETN